MNTTRFIRTLSSAAVIAALSGCGGGGGSTTSSPMIDNSTPDNGELVAAEDTISGRVADGYLQGATVCLDLNENKACDDDEPSTVSGEGGVYELPVAEGQEAASIVADVPETAIDEDTQQPVGKRLVLSAPPERREFISPITTLVDQELEDNPAFDVDAAEASVKQDLGLTEDDDASLFEDYVSGARNENAERPERPEQLRYLHQTAQIVARMMQEIQDEVEQAVSAEGIDIQGDPQARRALQQLLRNEVRELLPQITRAVADIVAAEASSESEAESEESQNADSEFDPDALASSLRPTNSGVDADRIQAQIDRRPATRVTVEDMLSAGFYIIDVDCNYEHDYDDEFEGEEEEFDEIKLDDDALNCYAGYSHLMLGDSGNTISQTEYEYDPETGSWIAYSEEQDFEDEPVYAFHLVEGQWQAESSADEQMTVEFTDNGGAIVMNSDGRMEIKASQHDLSERRLAHHLREQGAEREDAAEIAGDAVFPADSSAYVFHIGRAESQYLLFNWPAFEDGACDEFNGNCNVIHQQKDNGQMPVTSLATLADADAEGVTLSGLVHDYQDQPIDATFSQPGSADDGSRGIVTWQVAEYYRPDEFGPDEFGPEEFDPQEFEPEPFEPELCVGPDGELLDKLPEPAEGTEFDLLPDHNELDLQNDQGIEESVRPPELVSCYPDESGTSVSFANDDSGSPDHGSFQINRRNFGRSQWRMVEVQGVRMIELQVPVQLRHRIDMDDHGSILLVEHEGFVRRGGHFDDRGHEREIGYNEAAFSVMRDALQRYIGGE